MKRMYDCRVRFNARVGLEGYEVQILARDWSHPVSDGREDYVQAHFLESGRGLVVPRADVSRICIHCKQTIEQHSSKKRCLFHPTKFKRWGPK